MATNHHQLHQIRVKCIMVVNYQPTPGSPEDELMQNGGLYSEDFFYPAMQRHAQYLQQQHGPSNFPPGTNATASVLSGFGPQPRQNLSVHGSASLTNDGHSYAFLGSNIAFHGHGHTFGTNVNNKPDASGPIIVSNHMDHANIGAFNQTGTTTAPHNVAAAPSNALSVAVYKGRSYNVVPLPSTTSDGTSAASTHSNCIEVPMPAHALKDLSIMWRRATNAPAADQMFAHLPTGYRCFKRDRPEGSSHAADHFYPGHPSGKSFDSVP